MAEEDQGIDHMAAAAAAAEAAEDPHHHQHTVAEGRDVEAREADQEADREEA